ncbi:MAG: 50S ribosomal protein L34 [Phycisphaerales bacterium]
MSMHYEKRVSRVKRKRSIGFRTRMKTKNGRKMINRKRRAGRSLNVADKALGKPVRGSRRV